jgi:hypothetical protein
MRAFCLLLALSPLLAHPARGDFDAAGWEFRGPVTFSPADRSAGLAELPLPPEVLDRSRPDLADLRVVGEDGKEIPYVIEAPASAIPGEAAARVYNRSFLAGKSSSATADLGAKVRKNRVRVITAGDDFRRKIAIEGSDDGRSWRTLVPGALLFRVGPRGGAEYEKDLVSIPENDLRYLRVTVHNGPGDPGEVEIADILVRREPLPPSPALPVALAGSYVEQTGNRTILEFDLGYRHLPLRDLALSFSEANYFRRWRLSGRQGKTRIVKHAVEDAKPLERKVPEDWRPILSGAVFRYSGTEGGEQSPPVDLNGVGYRYLRVEIFNGDDPPLNFTGASVSRSERLIRFPASFGEGACLYFGNPAAAAPRYDLSHYASRLEGQGTAAAALGAPVANPAFGKARSLLPWSERHRAVVWLALLGGIVVLGLLILSQFRRRT